MEIYHWRPRTRISDALAARSRAFRAYSNSSRWGRTNFGDELARLIVKRVMALKGVQLSWRGAIRSSPTFFSLGSVTSLSRNGDVLWGTGHLSADIPALQKGVKSLSIRALRGPLTRELLVDLHGLMNVPTVFGDPGVLVPRIFPEWEPIRSIEDTLILPHLDDDPKKLVGIKGVDVVLPTEDPVGIVRRIAGANRIITSSLHGKILADAYGVPCEVYQGKTTARFKFDDFALGSDQEAFEFHPTVTSAIHADSSLPPRMDQVSDRLLDTFPMDIWA